MSEPATVTLTTHLPRTQTFYRVPQVAAALGFSKKHLYRLIHSGKVSAYRLFPNRHCAYRIPKPEVLRLLHLKATGDNDA